MDQDYIHKLSKEEAAWLNKFNEEYVNTALDRDNLKNNLHNTVALKKDCDKRSNDRRACILTRQKAQGRLEHLDDIIEETMNPVEDINFRLDLERVDLTESDLDDIIDQQKKKPSST